MLTRKQFFFLSAGTALAGCGGGSGETEVETPILPKVRVKWPAVTRAFEAAPYAKSVRVTLLNASLQPAIGERNVVIDGERTSDDAYEAEYVAEEPIRPGFVRAQIGFYVNGRQLQYAVRELELDENGYLPDISLGTGAGTVTAIWLSRDSTADTSISVKAGKPFGVWIFTPNFNFSRDDLNWDIVSSDAEQGPVIEPGTYNFSNPQPYQFKALRPGTATISLTVDGVTSNPFSVTVIP